MSEQESMQRWIVDNVAAHPGDIARVTAEHFDVSRQAVHRHLHDLVQMGWLIPNGDTKGRSYCLAQLVNHVARREIGPGVNEDEVWRNEILPHLKDVPANVRTICQHGITEIVNNAIVHSESPAFVVGISRTAAAIGLTVVDHGVGIFAKLQRAFGLDDPRHAVLELSKGKLTTDHAHHSGEGIFFTSRMFDLFGIMSAQLYFAHRDEKDWLLEIDPAPAAGTHVHMTIHPLSLRTALEVFNQFAPSTDHYGFTRTHLVASLAQHDGEMLVSRSQARRLLKRVDHFREVVLDFSGVESIGQGFADEIFRVFAREHPDIHIWQVNASSDVVRMILHVKSDGGNTETPFLPGMTPLSENGEGPRPKGETEIA
ncbi:MAG: STAS-like domain-containing protein [Deltaproteobacteria bacterium]|nr:STAS-like domain-containing protein [Deltaproteobacteria bacterium]MBI3388652.1 STAS-like domain-containing protein [Deltaproteobacteria bacterium]